MTNVTGAAVVDSQGEGTIVNEDAADAAPEVASTFPADGATNFPIGSNLTVTFTNRSMYPLLVHFSLFHQWSGYNRFQRWTYHLYARPGHHAGSR